MTTMFEWSDDYSIDGGVIDGQNKRLLQLGDDVLSLHDQEAKAHEIEGVVKQLYEFIGSHFSREERLMQETDFPAYDQHVATHRLIVKNLNELLKSCPDQGEFVSKLKAAMVQWVLGHIKGKDREFAEYINGRRAPGSDDPVGAEDATVELIHLTGEKILVVDDDASIRTLLVRALETAGTTNVIEAQDGEEALRLHEDNEFDLIVLDWNMPGKSGLEVLRTIRGNGSQTPVLMLTGESTREHVMKAIQSGVSDYLTKPFDQGVLMTKLQELCQRGRAPGKISAYRA